jgi:hypothetical protein
LLVLGMEAVLPSGGIPEPLLGRVAEDRFDLRADRERAPRVQRFAVRDRRHELDEGSVHRLGLVGTREDVLNDALDIRIAHAGRPPREEHRHARPPIEVVRVRMGAAMSTMHEDEIS